MNQPPPVLSGEFAGIRRFPVHDHSRWMARIGPGEYYATSNGELIATTLGSCVAACIRDPKSGIGGMNHFLLPDAWEGGAWESTLVSTPARYGNVAMERLINVVMGATSARRNLEVKVFGGAKVLKADIDIGERNISFIKSYLRTEGLVIKAQDLGGTAPRKVIFDVRSGDAFVKTLGTGVKKRIVHEEIEHLGSLRRPLEGDVQLFD